MANEVNNETENSANTEPTVSEQTNTNPSDDTMTEVSSVSIERNTDVVLIAGKGHETYQIVGNDKFYFDDREIARETLHNIREV